MKQLIKGLFSQILLLIVLFSTSCSEQKNEKSLKIIDVAGSVGGGRIIDISEVAEDIRYIPLETAEYSLVGGRVRVLYEKGRIYITDQTSILKIFDNEGKFLRNFDRRGRGPQEYLFPEVVYVSPQTGNLIINSLSTTRCVFKYDSTGKFIGKFATPENQRFSIDSPLWLDDNSYVSMIQSYKDKPESSAVVYDSLGKVKLFFPIPKLPPYQTFKELKLDMALRNKDGSITMVKGESDEKIISNPDKPFLYRFKDKIRVVYDSNDSVLSIGSDLLVDTPYIFNFGKFRNYSMDRSLIDAAKGEHVSLIGRFKMMETDGFLLMQVALRDYAHEPYEKARAGGDGTYALNDSYAIFNKGNGKFSFLNQTEKGVLGFRENLMDGPPFWPTYVSYDNSMVMVITAASLIEYANSHKVSEKLAKIVKNLKDTDNPIVVIAK
ncbi:MAG: 6-bladed beta-propeller [Bacteroidales bacterium]|jgi:hypothetical protein